MNSGQFRKGHDPRRHALTDAERRRGYRAAMAKLEQGDVRVYAWLYRKIRGYYRQQKRASVA